MCGRFYIQVSQKKLDEILDEVANNTADKTDLMTLKVQGEIFPTNIVPVETASGLRAMKWGFATSKRDVINARSETVWEKPMFRSAVLERRCVVPATGYYEWMPNEGGKKTKYQFSLANEEQIFLVGCYRQDRETRIPSFVILTKDATPEFAKIHNRMPVVFTREQADLWLHSDHIDFDEIIHDSVVDLEYSQTK